MIRGRQLSRDTEHRKALRRNLTQSLFEHGKVRTTEPKAKEIKAFAEKLITLAKTDSVLNRRRVTQLLNDRRVTDADQEFVLNERGRETTVVQRLFKEVAPKFASRNGGYTRIIKLADYRIGDGGSIVILQLLTDEDADNKPTGTVRRSAGLRRKRNEKRHEFAKKVLKAKGGTKTEAAAAAPVTPAEGGAE
jgi:large subunit ribosomal protein L17